MKTKKILLDTALGCLVTVVIGCLVEVGLWAAGRSLPEAVTHLSRGFDPDAPYFERDPDEPGAFRTLFVKAGHEELHIPPKGERVRVLLFGGSSTGNFHDQYLRRELDERGGRKGLFEVLNLGRAGYGSERVSVLFRQALRLLEPDVVVIYTGHNEFIERGFLMELDHAWMSGWTRTGVEVLRRTRTFHFVEELFAGKGEPRRARPEDWVSEYKKFAGLTYSETEAFFAAYAANLASMCEIATEQGVHVLLCTVIHNRLAAPFVATLPAALDAGQREAFEALHVAAAARYPGLLWPLLPMSEQDRLHGFDWRRWVADRAPDTGGPLPGRRPSLGALADQDPMYPPQINWSPKVRTLHLALEYVFEHELDGDQRAVLAEAALLLDQALVICPDHPRVLFERALVGYLVGEGEGELRERLELAARYDRAPRKANGATNDLVKGVASELPDVVLFDADAIFAERSSAGLIGWEWMTDHCHLNTGAIRVLMEDMAVAIVKSWYRPTGAHPGNGR